MLGRLEICLLHRCGKGLRVHGDGQFGHVVFHPFNRRHVALQQSPVSVYRQLSSIRTILSHLPAECNRVSPPSRRKNGGDAPWRPRAIVPYSGCRRSGRKAAKGAPPAPASRQDRRRRPDKRKGGPSPGFSHDPHPAVAPQRAAVHGVCACSSMRLSSSCGCIPSADAIRHRLSRFGFFSPRSIRPRWDLYMPASPLSTS